MKILKYKKKEMITKEVQEKQIMKKEMISKKTIKKEIKLQKKKIKIQKVKRRIVLDLKKRIIKKRKFAVQIWMIFKIKAKIVFFFIVEIAMNLTKYLIIMMIFHVLIIPFFTKIKI